MLAADLHQRVVRVREDVVLSLGLCWDYVGAAPVDLDLSAVCFTRDGQFVDVVFFGHAFPCATDAAALRRALVVDPSQLPYMFLSGDSTMGGEEANCTRLCTCELRSNGCSRPDDGVCGASRASRVAWPSRRTGACGACCSPATAAMDDDNDDSSDVDVFHRLYAEEELWDVQAALDRGELPASWTWQQQQQQQGDDHYARDACNVQHTHTSSPPQPHRRHRRQRRRRRALSDEVLTFVLHKVPAEAHVIFVCVTSYNGVALSTLPRVRLRLHNESDDVPVYTIDVARAMTGSCRNATGNLACMLVRAPPSPPPAATTITTTTMTTAGAACANAARCYWDVREMNVAAVAYTFVDVLPMMLTILGVPAHSRADALRRLPNYSLQKQHHSSSSRRSHHQHDQQQALTTTTTVACTLAASADADAAAWCTADASLLSDVRFAVGWHGAYDVSAFAVMLDAHNRYVDHVHAAHGKMRGSGAVACRTATTAMYRTCAAGVGGGDVVFGDREYIDLVTYRVPSRVRTIVVGAVYTLRRSSNHHNGSGGAATDGSDSDGDCGDVYGIGGSACDDDDDDNDDDAACGRDGDKRANAYSIYDVPSLYLRLQNRTLHNPYSTEIDRWRVDAARHATKTTTATHKQKSRAMRGDDDDAAAAVQTTYMTLDGTVQPVRTLLHGALLRTRRMAASCTAAAALPDDNDHNVYGDDEENGGRRDGMAALYADTTTTAAAACAQSLPPPAAAAAPFEYVPIHRAIPADARHGIDAVLPFLQFVAHCVWGHSHDDDNNDNNNDTAGGGTWHVAVTAASPFVHEADAAAAAASTTAAAAVAAGNDNDALSAPLTVQSLAPRTVQQQQGVSSSSSLLQARVAEATAATGQVAVPPPSSYLDVAHNLPTWRHAPLYDSAAATVTADAAALAIAAAAANDVDNNIGGSGGVRAYTRDDVTHARHHHHHNDSSSSRATRTTASAIGRLWDVWMRQYAPVLSECVAVEVQLLDVCGLQPRLPGRFRCHVEAWVCARASALLDAYTPRTPATARAFRSPYLYNADDLRWDTHNRAAAALFLVHRYDRIRLVVYEHAAVAVGELDLLSLTHLWQSPSSQQPQQSTYNDNSNNNDNNDDAEACTGPHGARYNSAVHTVALSSGTAAFASGCCVRVRVSRVPVSVARKHLLPAVAHDNRRRATTAQQRRRWTVCSTTARCKRVASCSIYVCVYVCVCVHEQGRGKA